MIRNIIWDVDGTLFDTYPAISNAFKLAVSDLGKDAPIDWIMDIAKVSLSHCTAALAEKFGRKIEDIEAGFLTHYDRVSPQDQPPFPGVIQICEYICLRGGKNLIVSHRGTQGISELLAAHRMETYFSGCISRDDGYPKKPSPAAFEAAIEIHRLVKEETITVGDRHIDIQAGQAAGLRTCLFDPQSAGSTADLTISSFNELLSYLKRPA